MQLEIRRFNDTSKYWDLVKADLSTIPAAPFRVLVVDDDERCRLDVSVSLYACLKEKGLGTVSQVLSSHPRVLLDFEAARGVDFPAFMRSCGIVFMDEELGRRIERGSQLLERWSHKLSPWLGTRVSYSGNIPDVVKRLTAGSFFSPSASIHAAVVKSGSGGSGIEDLIQAALLAYSEKVRPTLPGVQACLDSCAIRRTLPEHVTIGTQSFPVTEVFPELRGLNAADACLRLLGLRKHPDLAGCFSMALNTRGILQLTHAHKCSSSEGGFITTVQGLKRECSQQLTQLTTEITTACASNRALAGLVKDVKTFGTEVERISEGDWQIAARGQQEVKDIVNMRNDLFQRHTAEVEKIFSHIEEIKKAFVATFKVLFPVNAVLGNELRGLGKTLCRKEGKFSGKVFWFALGDKEAEVDPVSGLGCAVQTLGFLQEKDLAREVLSGSSDQTELLGFLRNSMPLTQMFGRIYACRFLADGTVEVCGMPHLTWCPGGVFAPVNYMSIVKMINWQKAEIGEIRAALVCTFCTYFGAIDGAYIYDNAARLYTTS